MTRGVDDVDLDILVDYGHILGQNGYASLPLDVVVVENKLTEILRLADKVGLIDHPVDQRSLAMVDMGDQRDISNFLHKM